MSGQKLWPQVISLALAMFFLAGCDSSPATPGSEAPAATATPKPPLATATPIPALTPAPLPPPCETHTAAVELSASATTLRVGDVVTIAVTLHNQSCSELGVHQYSLRSAPPLFDPGVPEEVTRPVVVEPGQADTVEFVWRAVKEGQASITAGARFEVFGGPGPAPSDGGYIAEQLVVNVMPLAQPFRPNNAARLSQVVRLGKGAVYDLAWSPDGKSLISGTSPGPYFLTAAASAPIIGLRRFLDEFDRLYLRCRRCTFNC